MDQRLGFIHPWDDYECYGYEPSDDKEALMDYVNILNGYKIRAYQWKSY